MIFSFGYITVLVTFSSGGEGWERSGEGGGPQKTFSLFGEGVGVQQKKLFSKGGVPPTVFFGVEGLSLLKIISFFLGGGCPTKKLFLLFYFSTFLLFYCDSCSYFDCLAIPRSSSV